MIALAKMIEAKMMASVSDSIASAYLPHSDVLDRPCLILIAFAATGGGRRRCASVRARGARGRTGHVHFERVATSVWLVWPANLATWRP
jgi:hypothetical protein